MLGRLLVQKTVRDSVLLLRLIHSSNLTDSFLNLREISAPKSTPVQAEMLQQNLTHSPVQSASAQVKPAPVAAGLGINAINGSGNLVAGKQDKNTNKAKDAKFEQLLSGAGTVNQQQQSPTLARTVDAHVTTGSMTRPFFVHDALQRDLLLRFHSLARQNKMAKLNFVYALIT